MKRQPKEYTGSCYIGAVGSDAWEYPDARDAIQKLLRRPGDTEVVWHRGTKGYDARQLHFTRWLGETSHPFMFLVDGDEAPPPDALERLRSHKLPYLSGYHMRRSTEPMVPLWYEFGPRGRWPMRPMTSEPERGKLHKIGASGWGCVLIHRDVAEAVRPLLKGEAFVIEDDLDVWPYNLAAVMGAIQGLTKLVEEKPSVQIVRPALQEYSRVLAQEIRPLRTLKSMVGSDLRFSFFAREAGFVLMGDPDVRCDHLIPYALTCDDFGAVMTNEGIAKGLRKVIGDGVRKERRQIDDALRTFTTS